MALDIEYMYPDSYVYSDFTKPTPKSFINPSLLSQEKKGKTIWESFLELLARLGLYTPKADELDTLINSMKSNPVVTEIKSPMYEVGSALTDEAFNKQIEKDIARTGPSLICPYSGSCIYKIQYGLIDFSAIDKTDPLAP